MSHPSPPIAGELVVIALKAEKLQHKAVKKQDPFCVFRVGDIIKRTKTDYGGGLYPIWDDQVNIPISVGQHQLQVQIFDKTTSPSNLMAEGMIDLRKVFKEKEHDGYFPLNFRGKSGAGVLYLELTFYSAVNASRPQQQVRYQHPAGYNQTNRPMYPHQAGYPPVQHHQQSRPLPPPQPMQQHQTRPPHIPQQQPVHRPLPQYNNNIRPPPVNQMHPAPPPQHQQHRPSPLHQQRPLPQPPVHHQHHPSLGTAQIISPTMSAPQPLLSAPYNPVPSPAAQPANLRQSYPPMVASGYPPQPQMNPGGFHDPTIQQHPPYSQAPLPQPQHHQTAGFYAPQPAPHPSMNNMPMPPPAGFRPPPPNGYPPY